MSLSQSPTVPPPATSQATTLQRQEPASRADIVAKDSTRTTTSENSLASATVSHESAVHPLKVVGDAGADTTTSSTTSTTAMPARGKHVPSMRLETSVRFSGIVNENEDLAAKAAYWRSRQEHVDAIDFYRFVENGGVGGRENVVLVIGASTAVPAAGNLESVAKEKRGAIITTGAFSEKVNISANANTAEYASIPLTATEAAVPDEKMVTIVGKRPAPPPPPPPKVQVRSTVYPPERSMGVLNAPILPPKVPQVDTSYTWSPGVQSAPRIPPKIPASQLSNPNSFPVNDGSSSDSYSTSKPSRNASPPPLWAQRPPPTHNSPSSDTAFITPTSSTTQTGEPNPWALTQHEEYSTRKYAGLPAGSPNQNNSNNNVMLPTKASLDEYFAALDQEVQKYLNSIPQAQSENITASVAKYILNREKFKAFEEIKEKGTNSAILSNDSPQTKFRRPPPSSPTSSTSHRLALRKTMATMSKAGIGSRTSLKLGLDLVMPYFNASPARPHHHTSSLNETHLTSMISNFSKPRGKGLAELSLGFSFLHLCIRLNNLELVKELVENGGADLRSTDSKTQTLMRNAIWYADVEMVEYLIQHGEDVNARGHYDSVSPLHHAVAAHNLGALKALVKAGADVNTTIRKNRKDLACVCRNKNAEPGTMERILEVIVNAGGKVLKSEDGGITPALFTGASGNLRVLETLRRNGVDEEDLAKLRDFELSAAILYNDVDKVKELITKGVDLNRRDIFRWRPLDSALVHKRSKIEEILVAAGAKPASTKKVSERKKKEGSINSRNSREDDNHSDTWSGVATGDRSDPEQWERGKDFRVKTR